MGVSLLALLAAGVAGQAPAAQPVQSATDRATQAPAPRDEAIIVTAQKREQRATDVPITLSALSGKRIADLGISDLDELSAFIPGLNIQEQSANNPGVVIRGITSDSGSAQQGPRVTLYYNGIDISRSRGSYQAIYDLERVEVIKGPQATLFGTASAVGAISQTSARPRPGFAAEVTAGLGNYQQRLLSGYVNHGNDRFAGRIAFEWRRRDGYVKNLNPAQDATLYAQNQLGVRGSLRWTPSPAITLDLIGTYDRQRNGGTPFISGTFATASGPANPFGDANLGGSPQSRDVLGLDRLGLRRDVADLNLTLNADLGGGWRFTTVNGYRDFDSLEVFDADGSAAWYLEFAELAKGWQASHEGRFAYASPRLRATFGWNLFREDGSQAVPFSAEEGTFLQCAARLIPGLACVDTNGVPTASRATAILSRGLLTAVPYRSRFENGGRNDSASLFADATLLAGSRLELTAGARLLFEWRQSRYSTLVPRPLLNPAATSLIPGQIDTAGQTYRAKDQFTALLPRFNALFRLDDRSNIYATISKGRRSPVVQLGARRDAAGLPQPLLQLVPEETVWNVEAGVKLGRGPVSGSLATYYQRYRGFQVSVVQANGQSVTQSAGSAGNLGVEAEIEWRATPWLRLFGNIGYIAGGVDKNNSFAPQFAGARFRLQPEWQGAAGALLDAPVGDGMRIFFAPSVTHRSRIFFELPNNPRLSQGATTLVHARGGFSFADRRYEVAAFVRNLFNKDFLLDAGNTGGAFGIPTFIPGEPRFIGAQFTVRMGRGAGQ